MRGESTDFMADDNQRHPETAENPGSREPPILQIQDKPNRLTNIIIGAAVASHIKLGPMPLEPTHEACVAVEFADHGLTL